MVVGVNVLSFHIFVVILQMECIIATWQRYDETDTIRHNGL